MRILLPLVPFVAALGLLACQGKDGPVGEDATAPSGEAPVNASANGAPVNAAAAEAVDRAAAPLSDNDMGWTSAAAGSVASFGPRGAQPTLTFACEDKTLFVTRLYPATPGATATLSFTGGGVASSLPMRAVAKPGDPGESEWQGEARGDMARAVARAFSGKGQVKVRLGGAPAIEVPTSPIADALFRRCAE